MDFVADTNDGANKSASMDVMENTNGNSGGVPETADSLQSITKTISLGGNLNLNLKIMK